MGRISWESMPAIDSNERFLRVTGVNTTEGNASRCQIRDHR